MEERQSLLEISLLEVIKTANIDDIPEGLPQISRNTYIITY